MNFDPDEFDINEEYEKDWTKTYNKEKVKFQYETRKKNNGNVLPSSTSSSNSSSSSSSSLPSSLPSSSSFSIFSNLPSSSSRFSNYSTNYAMFAPLTSTGLGYSVQGNLIIDVNGNNENAINRLFKVRDKIQVYKDRDSLIIIKSGEVKVSHILIILLIF
jgi:hypothetical protein